MRPVPLTVAILVALAPASICAATAGAADPGRWTLAGVDRVPQRYYQGLTHDDAGNVFWTGVQHGAYRGDVRLRQDLALDDAIPPQIVARDGFDHIGDPTWDPGDGGRLILPLECYRFGAPNGGNTCGRGGFAVLSRDLRWRLRVLLDPLEIAKAMWAEVSPDGKLIWTSGGSDLLAYRTADVNVAASAPLAAPLRSVIRLPGVVPAGGITGATFFGGRLLLAGQDGATLQVWSLDVSGDGPVDPRLEIERPIVGEAEGLDAFRALGGVLHWLVAPMTTSGRAPTYPGEGNVVLSFAPAGDGAIGATVRRVALRAGRPATLAVTVRQTLGGVTRALEHASVSAGSGRVLTDDSGRAELRVRPSRSGTLSLRVVKGELAPVRIALKVDAPIGRPITVRPTIVVSAGAGARRLRSQRLIDCSGPTGCRDAAAIPRLRGCVPMRAGSDLRFTLLRRPATRVDVLVNRDASAGRLVTGGRALATGRDALGWRFPVRAALPSPARLTLVVRYPDGTGALLSARLRARGGC